MKSRIISLMAILILLSVSTSVNAYTEKGGNVSGQVWPAGAYLVTSNLTVNDNTTLKIQAGAVVKFNPGLILTVYGTLLAQGASGNQVIFTSKDDDEYGEVIPGSDGEPAPGDWLGILCAGSYDNDGIGMFDYSILRYSGSHLYSFNALVKFSHSDSGSEMAYNVSKPKAW